jgi:hypothetical protein
VSRLLDAIDLIDQACGMIILEESKEAVFDRLHSAVAILEHLSGKEETV